MASSVSVAPAANESTGLLLISLYHTSRHEGLAPLSLSPASGGEGGVRGGVGTSTVPQTKPGNAAENLGGVETWSGHSDHPFRESMIGESTDLAERTVWEKEGEGKEGK